MADVFVSNQKKYIQVDTIVFTLSFPLFRRRANWSVQEDDKAAARHRPVHQVAQRVRHSSATDILLFALL